MKKKATGMTDAVRHQDVLALMRTNYNILSETQQRVADYIFENAETVMTTPLADLAGGCNVSEPTIFRFLRKLGFDSYQVFRVGLAQSLAEGKNENFYSEINEQDNAEAVRDKVLAFSTQCFTDAKQIIDADALERLVSRIEKSRRIVIAGIGASYCMAYDLYHKLMRVGVSSEATHDSHILDILSAQLRPKDMLITFSHSGESREILDAMRIAGNGGAFVGCITSYKGSSAAELADCTILSSSFETTFRTDSMASRILQMSIIDMIYVLLVLHNKEERVAEINRSRLAVARNKT